MRFYKKSIECIRVSEIMRKSTFFLITITSFIFSTQVVAVDDFGTYVRQLKEQYDINNSTLEVIYTKIKKNFEAQKLLNSKDTAKYGVTKFSHLSPQEFKDQFLSDLSHIQPLYLLGNKRTPTEKIKALNIPQKWDWRNVRGRNYISPIKNQNSCGACWAFSSAETVESMYAIKYNVTVPQLSVQEIVDCAVRNDGCGGGDTCSALYWLEQSHVPLVTEAQYPLTDKSDFCKVLAGGTKGVYVKNYTCDTMIGVEDIMLQWIYNIGPLTVAVDASTWNHYLGGVIQFHCEEIVNHAVQIVGYDISGDVPYYIVRNSWGPDYGNDGYLYIRVGGNLCGIAREVSTVKIL